MATKSSGLIDINQEYSLGEYVFGLQISGDETLTVVATCQKTDGSGSASQTKQIASGENMWSNGWTVDANDTTADVYIDLEELADHIVIETPPTKIKYRIGDKIDIAGMRVVPKRRDGTTWTNSKYFRGYIPLQELIIEPMIVDESQTGDYDEVIGVPDEWLEYLSVFPFVFDEVSTFSYQRSIPNPPPAYEGWYERNEYSFSSPVCVALFYGNDSSSASPILCVFAVKSNTPVTYTLQTTVHYKSGQETKTTTTGSIANRGTYHDEPYYYSTAITGSLFFDYVSVPTNPYPQGATINAAYCSLAMLFGEVVKYDPNIYVKWPRYGDKKILTDTFGIEVETTTNVNE